MFSKIITDYLRGLALRLSGCEGDVDWRDAEQLEDIAATMDEDRKRTVVLCEYKNEQGHTRHRTEGEQE